MTLILTERCNARCRHCFELEVDFMNQRRKMSFEDAKSYIKGVANEPQAQKAGYTLSFTGGEAFLHFDELVALTEYGAQLGAFQISCTTNGYWGKDLADARKKANRLAQAGMQNLGFSLDDFHQEFIPKEHLLNAITACREARMRYAIKSTVTTKTRRLHQLLADLGDHLLNETVSMQEIPYIPPTQEAENGPFKDELLFMAEVPDQPCPGALLAILPDGSAFPCCSIGWNDTMKLGSAKRDGVPAMLNKMENNILMEILLDSGPISFLPHLSKLDPAFGQRRWVSACHLCNDVTTHPEFSNTLPIVADQWRKRWAEKILSVA